MEARQHGIDIGAFAGFGVEREAAIPKGAVLIIENIGERSHRLASERAADGVVDGVDIRLGESGADTAMHEGDVVDDDNGVMGGDPAAIVAVWGPGDALLDIAERVAAV